MPLANFTSLRTIDSSPLQYLILRIIGRIIMNKLLYFCVCFALFEPQLIVANLLRGSITDVFSSGTFLCSNVSKSIVFKRFIANFRKI